MEQPKDGDGVVACVLPVLAQLVNHRSGKPSPFCECLIPSTVTFVYQIKSAWYYIKRDDMQLRTKLKSELSNAKIVDGFAADDLMLGSRYRPRCDIIATYIRSHTEHDPSADGGRRVVTMFDYFDKHRLREFLDAPPKSRHNNGILQRFVEGAGECNTVLRCTWTPRHVEISRRRSSRPLAKGFVKRLSAHHRRLATFEGPPVLSVNLPMSGAFPRRVIIEKTEAIVRHIQQIGNTPVAHIQLFFKVDRMDRVWLLFCSTLRLLELDPLTHLMHIAPLPEVALKLGVPFGERDGVFLGNKAEAPGGREGLAVSEEAAIMQAEASEEAAAEREQRALDKTSILAPLQGSAPYQQGRHLPWVDRSGISIPSQHSLSRTSVPVSGASNESLDRTGRPRALPLPDVEFSVGNIYRRAGRRKTRLSQPRNQSRSPTLTRRSQNSSNGSYSGGGSLQSLSTRSAPQLQAFCRILPSQARPLGYVDTVFDAFQ